MPSNSGRCGDAKCPFFKDTFSLTINCESPVKKAAVCRLVFRCKADYKDHFTNYCCSYEHDKCDLYKACSLNYTD